MYLTRPRFRLAASSIYLQAFYPWKYSLAHSQVEDKPKLLSG